MVQRKHIKWFERKFDNKTDNGLYLNIVERLTGTPLRLVAKVQSLEKNILTYQPEAKWTVKEQVGHLLDLEPLWKARVDDIKLNHGDLTIADLTNRQTHEANHNAADLEELLGAFVNARKELVAKFRSASLAELEYFAVHPRLKTPMRLVDLAYFVAEHDDHHLVEIGMLID